ncbi:MAG: alpha-L-fucosidase [Bacteroidales bacterium]|nr:alpha-L-fucosidase [Bacteroidales bacterium]
MKVRICLLTLVAAMQLAGAQAAPDPFVYPSREIETQYGVSMQPYGKLAWMAEGKIGLFIHWGLYAGPAKGEWYQENNGIPPEEYAALSRPESGEEYFDASQFDAADYTALAKRLGARYVTFTSQHHDGYALFDGSYNDFNSMRTHGRDFLREMTDACREAGLRVGVYKTLINWRYPGYYDVTGEDCARNRFGYVTDPAHKANARVLKEELYSLTRDIVTRYGRIDLIFWDGGWLGQRNHDADAAFFWEPGLYLDPANEWPLGGAYTERDGDGKALGLMGMVRKYQPDVITNSRSGWMGDFRNEEGIQPVTGPIRNGLVEKCFTIAPAAGRTDILASPAWGYSASMEDPALLLPLDEMKRLLADCMVRNMCYCINVGPDRFGRIPGPVNERLSALGTWIGRYADAIYGTVGGPWQPEDGKWGYCHKGDVIYLWLHAGAAYDSFALPPLRPGLRVVEAWKLGGGKVGFTQNGTRATLRGLGVDGSDISVIAVRLDRSIDADPPIAERINYFQIANYDEGKIPAYTLPDPLVDEDGNAVRNARQWKKRRAGIYELAQREMYGRMPARPREEHFRVLSTDPAAFGGLATAKRVRIYLTADESVAFDMTLWIPNGVRRPAPAFLGLTFGADDVWPAETVLRTGYALGTVAYEDIALDKSKAGVNGVLPFGYAEERERPVEGEWGTVAAWAWGLSRALDYLETDPAVNARKVAVIGHSRLGKVALWAAASDTRFAMAVSNDSGCCGAALSRRRIGETLAAVCQYSPQWFSPSFRKYRSDEDSLPFDQHEILALIAPRPLYVASASEDDWSDPRGEFLSARAASPVYERLGYRGLVGEEFPAADTPLQEGRIAYHVRSGAHGMTGWDWQQYLRFADRWLK